MNTEKKVGKKNIKGTCLQFVQSSDVQCIRNQFLIQQDNFPKEMGAAITFLYFI